MRTIRDHLAKTYFSFDPRSMGIFRIAYASVLLTDLYLRFQALDTFYTNTGLLPNHTLLWAPPSQRMISLFFAASTHSQALTLMILCALSFFALLLGWKTKIAQIASFIALTSMNTRLAPLENGGDMVMNLLGLWSLFLPLGQRFSIDSLLASLRRNEETDASELKDRTAVRGDLSRHYSLAVFALVLQFFVIYLFNVVHKDGATWLQGNAVHYTLHQDRLIKAFGVMMRDFPVWMLRGLTYGTICIEALGALAIISPFFTKYTRAFAVLVMPTLHFGFESALDLGVFSYSMMAFYPLLILPEHWERLHERFARLHRKRVVFFDAGCGICFAIVRALARLDVLERLDFVPNTDASRLPPGVTPELVESTIVVVDDERKHVSTRSHAAAMLLRSLPFGFLPSLVMRVPGIRQLADLAYDAVARNRAQISVWLGLAACGVKPPASIALPAAPESPARLSWLRIRRGMSQACIAVLMAACLGEVLNNNGAVPKALRFAQPQFFQAIIDYPRLYQGWRMFAPEAPLEDFMIEVDATTLDGRHVDPYNEVASRTHGPNFTEIPALLQQNQFFTAYSLFIWRPGFRAYLTAFREWVLRYHERTERPKDRIVRFTAYKLRDVSPPPGKKGNTGFTRESFMRYPEYGK